MEMPYENSMFYRLHNWEISHTNDYVTFWVCKNCSAMREEYHGK